MTGGKKGKKYDWLSILYSPLAGSDTFQSQFNNTVTQLRPQRFFILLLSVPSTTALSLCILCLINAMLFDRSPLVLRLPSTITILPPVSSPFLPQLL